MCTGNTLLFSFFIIIITVYPCVYRERTWPRGEPEKVAGLSLCVQGTHSANTMHLVLIRFIPVCTGNACHAEGYADALPVYPCVYRERFVGEKRLSVPFGLSLCVQGTPCLIQMQVLASRFIPVCTGNASGAYTGLVAKPVYPCVYRERPNYNILFYN